MSRLSWFVGAAIVGAGAMYFYDPERGNGRRALVRDRVQGLRNDLRDDLNVMVTDFRNRSQGALHEVKGSPSPQGLSNAVSRIRGSGEQCTPAVSLLVGSAGAVMSLLGLLRRGMFGGMMVTIGTGLVAKSFMDVEQEPSRAIREESGQDSEEDMGGEQGMDVPATKSRSKGSATIR